MRLSDLFKPAPEISPTDKEKQLAERAKYLEDMADHAERNAELRERITEAEKRINAVRPSGVFGRLGGGTRLLIFLAILFVIIFLIAKC